jgi:RNA polymerase sigma-70 factor (ECF subfamily)
MVDREVELMGRYCDGDAAAFNELYGLVAGKILAYLVGLTGDRAVAQDLLQLTFLKLHQARGTYVRGANPVPWIYTIAHRTFLDDIRKRQRARTRLHRDGETPETQAADLAGNPVEGNLSERGAVDVSPSNGNGDGDGEHSEAAAAALAALETLPQRQREALLLTKIHGRSLIEAAAITGTTPGAIKLRAHRAYVALRAKLSGKPKAAP